MHTKDRKGVLVLEDRGHPNDRLYFEGQLFGAETSAQKIRAAAKASRTQKERDKGYGEVVFNTSMTGYQEILTDPSYYGQIICMTVPHIGNVGVNREDYESHHPWCAGFLVHEICTSSNWRSEEELDVFLKNHGVPALSGVDTRALTRQLRSQGVVRGVILPAEEKDQAQALLKELPSFEGRDMIREVTTPEEFSWPKEKKQGWNPRFRVVALDFGMKLNILRKFEEQGCEIEVLAADAPAEEILKRNPDGVFLSNGPGDPTAATYAIDSVKKILGKVPIFGICMGHQILSLALGGRAFKLKFGHRGANQPIFENETGKVEISSQNHGYAISGDSLPDHVKITHVHLNDKTVAGLEAPDLNAFSVQYHPEASPGPHDSMLLFDRFVDRMEKGCTKST